jgi:hypothetical protein
VPGCGRALHASAGLMWNTARSTWADIQKKTFRAAEQELFGQGGETRVVLLPASLWRAPVHRGVTPGPMSQCSVPPRAVRWIRQRIASSRLPPSEPGCRRRCQRTGCATHMHPTLSTMARRSISCRRRSATAV